MRDPQLSRPRLCSGAQPLAVEQVCAGEFRRPRRGELLDRLVVGFCLSGRSRAAPATSEQAQGACRCRWPRPDRQRFERRRGLVSPERTAASTRSGSTREYTPIVIALDQARATAGRARSRLREVEDHPGDAGDGHRGAVAEHARPSIACRVAAQALGVAVPREELGVAVHLPLVGGRAEGGTASGGPR